MKREKRASFKDFPILKKILWVGLAIAAVWLVLSATDVGQHFLGMGSSDRMSIRVALDGEALRPSAYTVSYILDHDDGKRIAANPTSAGYAIDSGDGFYEITVGLPEKEISFAVENVNSWWRSDIALDITTLADGRLQIVETLAIVNVESAEPIMTEWTE